MDDREARRETVAEFDVDQFWAAEAEMKRVAWEIQNAQAQLETARREGAAAARVAKLAGHRITDIARLLGVNRTTADKWSAISLSPSDRRLRGSQAVSGGGPGSSS